MRFATAQVDGEVRSGVVRHGGLHLLPAPTTVLELVPAGSARGRDGRA